jgi:hypothetical protein
LSESTVDDASDEAPATLAVACSEELATSGSVAAAAGATPGGAGGAGSGEDPLGVSSGATGAA